jgi:hypothetical protein
MSTGLVRDPLHIYKLAPLTVSTVCARHSFQIAYVIMNIIISYDIICHHWSVLAIMLFQTPVNQVNVYLTQ